MVRGAAAAEGLRLLAQAAAACQTVPFHGVELLDLPGRAGPGTSVVDVWHAAGTPPLMRPLAQPTCQAGRITSSRPVTATPLRAWTTTACSA